MARLIDADELWMIKFPCPVTPYETGWDNAIQAIVENAPTVDAVEVVRCKDCIYFNRETKHAGCCKCEEVNDVNTFSLANVRTCDDFCSYGKRRADNGKAD